ncbi:MAG: hypothetical protein ABIJ03_02470 [Patescibacteria group bacterium]|nr:hypothetical protein [Patescibacteria group bacterium]
MKSEELEKQLRVLIKTRHSLVLSGLLVIIGVMLIGLVMLPQIKSIISLRQKISQETGQLAKLQQKVLELNEALISPEYSQVDVVNQALPSKKPILDLLMSLSTTISRSGVKLEQLELSPGLIATEGAEQSGTVKKQSGVNKDNLALSLKISGSFSQVEEFMKRVEEISPFTTITSFNLSEKLSKADETTDSTIKVDQVAITMDIQTFFFVQTIKQTLEKPLPVLSNTERETLRQLANFRTSGLAEQNEIMGGGLEDLFGVAGYGPELKQLLQEAQ